MLGAVVGDVLGSVYERGKRLPRSSALPPPGARFTDDTVFTLATAEALLFGRSVATTFRSWGARYAQVGASRQFSAWLAAVDAPPYQGDTNGALMRVSPAIALARDVDQAQDQARAVTAVSHDHPRALAAVAAYTDALWAALQGQSRDEVCAHMRLPADAGMPLDQLHEAAAFRMKADQTLADVRECVLDASSFEQAMRNCVYCGGDVDTLCAVAGPLAEGLWGIPDSYVQATLAVLPAEALRLLQTLYHMLAARHTRPWAHQHQSTLFARVAKLS